MILADEYILRELNNSWFLLYGVFAEDILSFYGSEGSEILRNTIKDYGKLLGIAERTATIENGHKINLKNFFWKNFVQVPDPRFKFQVQFVTEESCAFDILTCPLYSYFLRDDRIHLLLPYCEEFSRSFALGYCGPQVQTNLSEMLIRKDEYSCRFSHYFRKSNLELEVRKMHFSDVEVNREIIDVSDGEKQLLAIPDILAAVEGSQKKAAFQVYEFIKCVNNRLHNEKNSDRLIVEAIKKSSQTIIDYLRSMSIHHNLTYDEAFLRIRSWVYELENILNEISDRKLAQIIDQNLVVPIKNSAVTIEYLGD